MAQTPSRAVEYVTFRVGRADLAMRQDRIKAFLPWNQLAPRDQAPAHTDVVDLAGFAMCGGRLLPVIDLGRRLGLRRAHRGRTPSIVVVELFRGSEPYLSGFIADVLSDIVFARPRDLHGEILHTGGRPRTVIDPDQFLHWRAFPRSI